MNNILRFAIFTALTASITGTTAIDAQQVSGPQASALSQEQPQFQPQAIPLAPDGSAPPSLTNTHVYRGETMQQPSSGAQIVTGANPYANITAAPQQPSPQSTVIQQQPQQNSY